MVIQQGTAVCWTQTFVKPYFFVSREHFQTKSEIKRNSMSYWYIVQEGDLKILMDTKLVPSGFLIYSILGIINN